MSTLNSTDNNKITTKWISSSVRMFADETKVWTQISDPEDGKCLQEDLNRLTSWSDKWKMGFNPEKCQVMHIGHSFDTKYKMIVQGKHWKLDETKEQRDLGIIVMTI